MKINKTVLSLMLVAGVAFGAAMVRVVSDTPWFQQGLIVRPYAERSNLSTSKVTDIVPCDVDFDFPTLAPDGKVGAGTTSFAKSCSGVVTGDKCLVSSKAYADGGIGEDVDVIARAVGTDQVKLTAHNLVNDAGSTNPVDAGFHVLCFSTIAR